MAEGKKPLSLNERHQLLVRELSRSRVRNPSPPMEPQEERVSKVKIEGRRRLCKISSVVAAGEVPTEGAPKKEDGLGGSEDSIRDILDDLSSRLDALSVEKPRVARGDPEQAQGEFKSATSSLSPLSLFSDSDLEENAEKKEVEIKEKAVAPEEDDEEVVVVVEDFNEGRAGLREEESDREPDSVVEDGSIGVLSDDDGCDDDTKDIMLVGTGTSKSRTYTLPGKIMKMLYPHQRDGLTWLWSLHCRETGGILGDDMGLGKTMQVSAFLAGLLCSHLIKRALIVAPKTLLPHWMKELSVVGLADKIRDYSGTCQKLRQYQLQHILKEGGLLLTTYDIVRTSAKSIRGDWYSCGEKSEDEIVWDYTILDEGHIIKNPKTQRAKSLLEIPSSHRIIISGTPIQNNLKELWALFNFCCPEVLGDKDEFKIRYEHPILRGNDKNASDREKHIGSTVARELRERIKPYFLRRLKSEVFLEGNASKGAKLSKKNEMIVWLKLTSCQRQLYEAFLNSEMAHLSTNGSPLTALTILKKICDHPLLLTKKGAEGILEGMDTMLNREELNIVEEMAINLANNSAALQVDHNVSSKMCFILSLLENLVGEGHVVLIFSQTRKMLNLIQEAIICKGYKFSRIDGTTKVSERERIVKDFQEGSGAPIFLLTSQVGGLGLTLTKADRVIVVDPAWNPSTDNQSVDRAYRIGQNRDVIVYRLMTCGTIEEKIYKMQVFKGGLFRSATEHKEQTRYFSQKDISELFSLPEQGFDVSLTQQQLHEEHDQHHTMDNSLANHINFLERQGIAGVSFHSLLYSKAETVGFVGEHHEVPRKVASKVIRNSAASSSLERDVDGAEFALNPKHQKFNMRANSFKASPNEAGQSPEEINERIKRLSHTLANKTLVSRLPDQGEKIKKQISELIEIRDSPQKPTSDVEGAEVIDLDDLLSALSV